MPHSGRALLTRFSVCLFALGISILNLEAKPYTMKTLPAEGLNVDWPVLKEGQYFSFKGRTANYVTLRYLVMLECDDFIYLYAKDPHAIIDELMMLILVNLALRGVDITTMPEAVLREEALAHILKKLRQLGRIEEMQGMLKDPQIVPGLPGCCELLAMIKNDILAQRNHVDYQWDLQRRANGGAGTSPTAGK